jgi:hypothetical protein
MSEFATGFIIGAMLVSTAVNTATLIGFYKECKATSKDPKNYKIKDWIKEIIEVQKAIAVEEYEERKQKWLQKRAKKRNKK